MLSRGKLAILAMLLLAFTLTGISVVWHYYQGDQAKEFWGTKSAVLIRHAAKVEVLQLRLANGVTGSEAERLTIDNVLFDVVQKKDISQMRGLIHARHALIEDASFHWDKTRGECQGQWNCAMRFTAGDSSAIVLFDFECELARLILSPREVRVTSHIMAGLKRYIAE